MTIRTRFASGYDAVASFLRRHRNLRSGAVAAGLFAVGAYFAMAVLDYVDFENRRISAQEVPVSMVLASLSGDEPRGYISAQLDNGWIFAVRPDGGEDAARLSADARSAVADLYVFSTVPLSDRAPRRSPEVVLTTVLTMALVGFIVRHMLATSVLARSVGEVVKTEEIDVRFSDVAGAREAKQDLLEIVELMSGERCYGAVGAKLPKGVLFHGPPGTGKTLLAKATAGEAHVNFIAVTGSDFGGMMVGRGAQDVAGLFAKARRMSPCILFIDEIDAVGKRRGERTHADLETTLLKLLSELNGMKDRDGVVVIGATNHVDDLDPALVRPGRFDRIIHVSLPDREARLELLQVHTRGMPLASAEILAAVAEQTAGMSGADLSNLCNEAAVHAGRTRSARIDAEEFDAALMKIKLGEATGGVPLDAKERRRLAYHEAGHAVMSLEEDDTQRIHRVTIEPRGTRLGHVYTVPERDIRVLSRAQMISRMRVLAGGRAAEIVALGEQGVSTLAEDDIAQASGIAWEL